MSSTRPAVAALLSRRRPRARGDGRRRARRPVAGGRAAAEGAHRAARGLSYSGSDRRRRLRAPPPSARSRRARRPDRSRPPRLGRRRRGARRRRVRDAARRRARSTTQLRRACSCIPARRASTTARTRREHSLEVQLRSCLRDARPVHAAAARGRRRAPDDGGGGCSISCGAARDARRREQRSEPLPRLRDGARARRADRGRDRRPATPTAIADDDACGARPIRGSPAPRRAGVPRRPTARPAQLRRHGRRSRARRRLRRASRSRAVRPS